MFASLSGGGVTPNLSSASDFGGVNQKIPTGIAPLESDSVEFSAENKIKETKKSGLSTGAKWTLGILGSAAAIYGCVVGHRALNKPTLEKVQKNFSEIFRRDVSKEEAEKLANKYKEIFKINDTDEFCTKMFEQVKKDYGYEKANIPLEIDYRTGKESLKECMQYRAGGFSSTECYMLLSLPVVKGAKLSKGTKKEVLKTLLHEFRHTQQAEMCYRTNFQKYLEALEKNAKKDIGNIDKTIEEFKRTLNSKSKLIKYAEKANVTPEKAKIAIEKLIKILEKKDQKAMIFASGNSFDKALVSNNLNRCFNGVEPTIDINKYSDEIQKFMENSANYLQVGPNVTRNQYMAQPLETDAFNVSDMANYLYKYISFK